MKKKIVIFIVLILLAGIAVCFLPWQHNISTTLNGVQRRIGNDEYTEEVTITVTGTYNRYLFRNDTFFGTISTNLYGDIWSLSNGKLSFSDNTARMISMNSDNNDYFKSNYFGELLCAENFSEILILVCETIKGDSKGWNGKDGLYITAPANDKAQSIRIAQRLSKKTKWLSADIWE
jgi:hypothetical protein